MSVRMVQSSITDASSSSNSVQGLKKTGAKEGSTLRMKIADFFSSIISFLQKIFQRGNNSDTIKSVISTTPNQTLYNFVYPPSTPKYVPKGEIVPGTELTEIALSVFGVDGE